jgi:fatty acid desaturase
MARLSSLNGWQLLAFLLALATAVGFAVWAIVWVMWTIRPLLVAAAALAAVALTLRALRHHRANNDWQAEEWIGS